jgi:hypothetical protein
MIRYPHALDEIEKAIKAGQARWLAKAAARTNRLINLGKYAEEYTDTKGVKKTLPPFWSEVKPFYMRHQYNKCVYCETKLEGREYAPIQWDLEHFRPKSNVRKWPSEKSEYTYPFTTGGDWAEGYYLLAYHLRNYAVACKTCNSLFKSDFFPIASARIRGKLRPIDYAPEEAFLVYPLDIHDDDPEDLIAFTGEQATPRYQRGQNERKWKRARIMIDFFGLNRDGLVERRAWWLLHAVWPNVKLADAGDSVGQRNLVRISSERAPFTNCAKCFLALCAKDRLAAEAMIPEFEQIVETMEA